MPNVCIFGSYESSKSFQKPLSPSVQSCKLSTGSFSVNVYVIHSLPCIFNISIDHWPSGSQYTCSLLVNLIHEICDADQICDRSELTDSEYLHHIWAQIKYYILYYRVDLHQIIQTENTHLYPLSIDHSIMGNGHILLSIFDSWQSTPRRLIVYDCQCYSSAATLAQSQE